MLHRQIEEIKNDRQADTLIWSGYAKFDRLTGGFRLGEFVVIGGHPGMGKTQLLINLALNISKAHPVLFITYEDSEQAISQRFLSSISGIPAHKFKFKLKNEEKESLIQETDSFDNDHLFITANPNMPVEEVKNYCISQIKDNGVKIIMIDNLHELYSETSTYPDRKSELAYITKELKNLAQQQQICVIVTSQMNRNMDKRYGLYNKHAVLSDLKGSNAIEENADKVIFIFRPEDEEGNSLQNLVELLIGKNKNGKTGDIRLMKTKAFTNIIDLDFHRPTQKKKMDLN